MCSFKVHIINLLHFDVQVCCISIWNELLRVLFLVPCKSVDLYGKGWWVVLAALTKMKGRRLSCNNKELSVNKLKSFMVLFSGKEAKRDG